MRVSSESWPLLVTPILVVGRHRPPRQTLQEDRQSTRTEIESFEDCNDFSETLTRAKFEELNTDLFGKTMKPVKQVLKNANLKKGDIDEVSDPGNR